MAEDSDSVLPFTAEVFSGKFIPKAIFKSFGMLSMHNYFRNCHELGVNLPILKVLLTILPKHYIKSFAVQNKMYFLLNSFTKSFTFTIWNRQQTECEELLNRLY